MNRYVILIFILLCPLLIQCGQPDTRIDATSVPTLSAYLTPQENALHAESILSASTTPLSAYPVPFPPLETPVIPGTVNDLGTPYPTLNAVSQTEVALKNASLQAQRDWAATAQAAPTRDPNLPPPETLRPITPQPIRYGIINDTSCRDDFTIEGIRFAQYNCWQGVVDNHYIHIAAGGRIDSPHPDLQMRGGVMIYQGDVTNPRNGQFDPTIYFTPTNGGAVRIMKAQGTQFTMQAENGAIFLFDLPTKSWQISQSSRIKNSTFEDGQVIHATTGVDSVLGGVTIETNQALRGNYAVRIPNIGNAYIREDFTAASDLYAVFYIRLNALPSTSIQFVTLTDEKGGTVGNIQLRTSGQLRLRVGTNSVGSDSSALQVGYIYVIALHQKQGTGNNAVLEAYLTSKPGQLGVPFAVTTNGAWTTRITRLRIGPTAATPMDVVIDNVFIDTFALPQ